MSLKPDLYFAIFMSIWGCLEASADTIYVKQNALSGDGSSWATAFTSLNEAVISAAEGDEVWIAEGTYRPNDLDPTNHDRTQSFQLKNGVTVRGGFAGSETEETERIPGAHPVILSGDLWGDDEDADEDGFLDENSMQDNSFHVFYHPAELGIDQTAILEAVTISGGNAIDSPMGAYGGAIHSLNGAPFLKWCTLTQNIALHGGVIYYTNETDTISTAFDACTFYRNRARNAAAVIDIENVVSTFTNCTFVKNYSLNSASILDSSAEDGTITFRHCTITDNGYKSFSLSITGDSKIVFKNSIVFHNHGDDFFPSRSASLVQSIHDENGDNDPLLLPLGWYGGYVPTSPIASMSPAKDTGSPIYGISQDARGIIRDSLPDIGACELNPSQTKVGIVKPELYTHFPAGSRIEVHLRYELIGASHQWYLGQSGDISTPIPGEVDVSLVIQNLQEPTKIWVRTTYSGGSLDSESLEFGIAPPIIHLSPTGNDGNDGTSWASAVRSYTKAVDLAGEGSQIWIREGLYKANDHEPSENSRGFSFALKPGVSLYGGFKGTEISLEERLGAAELTIFSGDLAGNDLDTDDDGYLELETMSDNTFQMLRVNPFYFYDIDIHSIHITAANGHGRSVLHTVEHNLNLVNTSITNSIGDVLFVRGGIIHLKNCRLLQNKNTINGSSGPFSFSSNSSLTIEDSLFENNKGERGGALSLSGSGFTLSGTTFAGNHASIIGGAIYSSSWLYSFTIKNCLFLKNTSVGGGGGIYLQLSSLFTPDAGNMVINNTFSENEALIGAGLYISVSSFSDPNLTLSNLTFIANKAKASTGAVYARVYSGSDINLEITNSIFWGNTNGDLRGVEVTGPCIIETGSASDIILIEDPQLSPLDDYGGLTKTARPLLGSPAIDAGIPIEGVTTDQRGYARDSFPDIGATEFRGAQILSPLDHQPASLGEQIELTSTSDLDTPATSYQWFVGKSGDETNPVDGAAGASYLTDDLSEGMDLWLKIISNSVSFNSPTFSLPVRGTFADWVAFHELTGPNAGSDAEPGNDGIPNLLKFATGLSPNQSHMSSDFLRFVMNEEGQPTLLYRKSLTPTDVSLEVESTPTLLTPAWSEENLISSKTSDDTAAEWWQVPYPTDMISFMRVKASQTP